MSSLATQQREVRPEVLGVLAHELRQPLSNIEAIAYYLSMVLPPGDVKIQAHLARIRELVAQSNWILSSALNLTASAPAAPQAIALEKLITESVSFSGDQAHVNLALCGGLPLVHLDPREARDLVDSLLMLFRTLSDGSGPVTVTTSAPSEGGVLLEIQVSGDGSRGVSGAGSELALESACRIARSHGGTFVLDGGGAAGGIRGRLMLP